jgi:hypothetical protein
MTTPLTSNTQAILLLTAPLVAGRGDLSAKLFSLGEYNKPVLIQQGGRPWPNPGNGAELGQMLAAAAEAVAAEPKQEALSFGPN